ncbi:MAG: CDP-diacylglycerol--glycerol-3-phosphate 3-phosphatidyltransferase, partial [Clostridiales bacterium]
MNLPNKISLARIFLIPIFLAGFFCLPHGEAWSAVIFAIAGASDALDGNIARKQGLVTTMGKFIDPLADKLLVLTALIALLSHGMISAVAVAVIIWREISVDGLRILAADKGEVIAASQWGKLKTTSQIVAILALLVSKLSLWPQPLYQILCQILIWGAVG